MTTTTPCLWFDGNAEEAANFYVGLFKSGKIISVRRFGPGAPFPEGSAMSVNFELDGREFMGLNGGPAYHFTPAMSLFVTCDTQEEVDHFWNGFLDGGTPIRCGWITDRFGFSWQIVPRVLDELLQSPDREKAGRAMKAMLGMVKLDIAGLRKAYDGG
jgi:predicted 3-demethylubiquinone-9 3-methyltransferase (glyoxalase superfamily)